MPLNDFPDDAQQCGSGFVLIDVDIHIDVNIHAVRRSGTVPIMGTSGLIFFIFCGRDEQNHP